jgi:hypothetical protein
MRRWDFLLVAAMLGMTGAGVQAQTGPVLRVEWQASLPANLPPGSLLLCRAKIVPGVGRDIGSEESSEASAAGVNNGAKVDCAVEVPVGQAVRSPGVARLSVEVDAVSPSAAGPQMMRLVLAEDVPARPAWGSALRVSLQR